MLWINNTLLDNEACEHVLYKATWYNMIDYITLHIICIIYNSNNLQNTFDVFHSFTVLRAHIDHARAVWSWIHLNYWHWINILINHLYAFTIGFLNYYCEFNVQINTVRDEYGMDIGWSMQKYLIRLKVLSSNLNLNLLDFSA